MSLPFDALARSVETAELRAALEQALSRHFGVERSISGLERRPSPYRTSYSLEELDLRLANDTTLQLMFKDLSRQALLEGARQAKPTFLHDPLREIETYRAILGPTRLGTATYYGAVVDDEIGRYWLFLEKVAGVELYQVGELSVWQHVARWLAGMHDRFVGETGRPSWAAHLLNYDGNFYRLWPARARAFLRQRGLLHSGEARRRFDRLTERYDQVVERLVALPVTLIHGEFYASNILVQPTAEGMRVCPVDWEVAALGPGLIDLAALTTGRWTEDQRMALAMAYYAGLAPNGSWPPPLDVFVSAFQCCHLHVAMQWLGWAPEWSPPPEHAQDWLQDALILAEKLGL